LSDPHWSVRKAAIGALGRERTGAVDALLETIAADDPDAAVRQAAKEALGR
jgi:HEAT repeat protein